MAKSSDLLSLLARDNFISVGLMSGTSMDGVDAALVAMDAAPDEPNPRLIAFKTMAYPNELKLALMDMAVGQQCTAEDVATLNTGVAIAFARSFFEVCKEAGQDPGNIDFIGSHGQTVAHVPPGGTGGPIYGTLQFGSPSMIAALTGVTTVGDFRSGDIALGGQGAPLAPYVDFLLRRSSSANRIILNVGGIANVTYLPKGGKREETVAFDTGPGNMVIDAVHRALFPGKGDFDSSGGEAGQGIPASKLVDKFMENPYFKRKPPKSAGHREFGVAFAWEFLSRARALGLSKEDTIATAAMITARSIGSAIDEFIKPLGDIDEIFICGGGARNETLAKMIADAVYPIEVDPIDKLGISAEAKEAVDFAVLARETILGRINVISSVTGSAKGTVLGTIALGSNS